MNTTIIDFISNYGYLAVAILIAVENIFPPIPSEVILTFGGFLTTYTSLEVPGVVAAATFGSLAGAAVLYGAGMLLNKERLKKIVSGRAGKLLGLKAGDVEKADGWFQKTGTKAVFFCRCVPVVRSLISIPAGMSRMKLCIRRPVRPSGISFWFPWGPFWENPGDILLIWRESIPTLC